MSDRCEICHGECVTMRLFSDIARKQSRNSLGIGERVLRCQKCLSLFDTIGRLVKKGENVTEDQWKKFRKKRRKK